ncbi:hypothetical protein NDU88_006814 [Pleurodeles waltl]|uniref:Uncharacterized protein n=1 Tax=Pleurodeles waltl TaxID=8319 RepID=A0AAV7TXX1_PLEWA|nr:hypothetical protein NDU88_006814 [Pleurodeles waltl]
MLRCPGEGAPGTRPSMAQKPLIALTICPCLRAPASATETPAPAQLRHLHHQPSRGTCTTSPVETPDPVQVPAPAQLRHLHQPSGGTCTSPAETEPPELLETVCSFCDLQGWPAFRFPWQ